MEEQKYKLEYEFGVYETLKKDRRDICIGITAMVVVIFLSFLPAVNVNNKFIKLLFLIVFCFYVLGLILLNFYYKKKKEKYMKMKELGTKSCGYIRKAYIHQKTMSSTYSVHINVSYNGKTKNISGLIDNEAFYVLKLLLDSELYPIKKINKISIDIYTYKNVLYFDLDSVDLTQVEGFEEAKKLLLKSK